MRITPRLSDGDTKKDFIGFAVLSTDLFPLKGRLQTIKEFLMKKLEIIIRQNKLDEVKTALSQAGVHGMSYTEIRGCGRQMGHEEIYRGRTVQVDFLPKLKLEAVVEDAIVEQVLAAVTDAARTGEIGDGKIFIFEALDAVRIRTGERGAEAL